MSLSLLSFVLGGNGIFTIVLLLTLYNFKQLPRWMEMARWVIDGPSLLASKYTSGQPFTIQTPERQYVLVSSHKHIKELSQAKEEHLSLVATAEEVFQPAHTMNGVDMHRLGMQHRILRTMSLKLSASQPALAALIEHTIVHQLDGRSRNPNHDGWQSLPIFRFTQLTVAKANTLTFYGLHFTNDAAFLEAAQRYPQDVFFAAEAIRCVPSFFRPMLSWVVTRGHSSSRTMTKKLLPVFEQRIRGDRPSSNDYIQHIVDVYPDKSSDMGVEMVNQTLALWFASVHQPAIALCHLIEDLCTHAEFQAPLRTEIEHNIESNGSLDLNKLPLMESFMRESARLNASESISLRRKATEPFQFQDGLKVAKGDWLCVPQKQIMQDPLLYPDAAQFRAFRFSDALHTTRANLQDKEPIKFSDTHSFYTLWGLGKHACPGRFYASFIIKLTLVELLRNYEVRLPKDWVTRKVQWRSSILPMPTAKLEIRLRA